MIRISAKRVVLLVVFILTCGCIALLARPVRAIRRWFGAPPRILRGTTALHSVRDNATADRSRGFRIRTVVRTVSSFAYKFVDRREFDVVLDQSRKRIWLATCLSFGRMLWQFDIWVTFFNGFHFVSREYHVWELRLARLAGVRVIATSYGSDCTILDGRKTRFNWIQRLMEDKNYTDLSAHNRRTSVQLQLMDKYSDFIIAPDYTLKPFFRRSDLTFKYFPVDLSRLRPVYQTKNRVPKIVHAPNHRQVKGTDILIEACSQLRSRGVEFELVIVERIERSQAFDLYTEADVFAEQFVMGTFGSLGLEGLALGKPVLTFCCYEELLDPHFNLPVVNTHRENIVDVLSVLLAIPLLRERLGRLGRKAVENFHSFDAIGEVWEALYEHLWFGTALRLDSTKHFSPLRQPRSVCEDPAVPEFWPTEVHDLLPQIQEVLKPGVFRKAS